MHAETSEIHLQIRSTRRSAACRQFLANCCRTLRSGVLAGCCVWLIGLPCVQAEKYQVTDTWVMEITPASRAVVGLPAAEVPAAPLPADAVPADAATASPSAAPARAVDPREYARIYRTIPFNRAEYNVNPSYRHDATMEILTGNPRHQTIVEHTNVRPEPVAPVAPPVLPWRYNNPDLGLNYYFYFPYWNFRGYF